MISKITINKFKKISQIDINLDSINILVGGNNSGKSSVLQGIHFKLMAAAISRKQQLQTFSSEDLLYNPANDFSKLRNELSYGNSASSGLDSSIEFYNNDGKTYRVRIYKGRNYGNIGVDRTGDYANFGVHLTDYIKLYSIYVPGLAGISSKEELHSMAIVRKGVAGGEANVYLRNIIHYIKKDNKLDELNVLIKSIFKNVQIKTEFDELHDVLINTFCEVNGTSIPLELVGTGILQAIQIFSYIVYFQPKLLLLDEPDSHLHPDNQRLLVDVLQEVVLKYKTQIIISTHSRHILDSLYGKGNMIWISNGNVIESGYDVEKISLLMEIGALDKIEELITGKVKYCVLTEDRDKQYIETLFLANGFKRDEIFIHSYLSSSNLDYIEIIIKFLKELLSNCKIIVHRDRDFMTEDEVKQVENSIKSKGGIAFITEGSDIESYFISSEHIARCIEKSKDDIEKWIEELVREHHNEMLLDFSNKRNEVKNKLYKKDKDKCPDVKEMVKGLELMPIDKIKGKFILKKINGTMYQRFQKEGNLNFESEYLSSKTLKDISQS